MMLRALLLLLLSGLAPTLVQAAIETRAVEYRQGDTRLVGYLTPKDARRPLPGVLVVHEWKGLAMQQFFAELFAKPQ